MRTVYIETYGCQMNLADTELLLGHLARSGYARTDDPGAADVILLNTCAIREHAEERVMGRLGELQHHKARRPTVQLGLAGCMAQHVRDTLTAKLPFVDFIVGPDAYRGCPSCSATRRAIRSSTSAWTAVRPMPTSPRSATAACAAG